MKKNSFFQSLTPLFDGMTPEDRKRTALLTGGVVLLGVILLGALFMRNKSKPKEIISDTQKDPVEFSVSQESDDIKIVVTPQSDASSEEVSYGPKELPQRNTSQSVSESEEKPTATSENIIVSGKTPVQKPNEQPAQNSEQRPEESSEPIQKSEEPIQESTPTGDDLPESQKHPDLPIGIDFGDAKAFRNLSVYTDEDGFSVRNKNIASLNIGENFQGVVVKAIEESQKDQYPHAEFVEGNNRTYAIYMPEDPDNDLVKVFNNFKEALIVPSVVKEHIVFGDVKDELPRSKGNADQEWAGMIETLKGDPARIEWSKQLPLLSPSDKYVVSGKDVRRYQGETPEYTFTQGDFDGDGATEYLLRAASPSDGYRAIFKSTEEGLIRVGLFSGQGELLQGEKGLLSVSSANVEEGKKLSLGDALKEENRSEVLFRMIPDVEGKELAEKYPGFVIVPGKEDYYLIERKTFDAFMDDAMYQLGQSQTLPYSTIEGSIQESKTPDDAAAYLSKTFPNLPISIDAWRQAKGTEEFKDLDTLTKETLDEQFKEQ